MPTEHIRGFDEALKSGMPGFVPTFRPDAKRAGDKKSNGDCNE